MGIKKFFPTYFKKVINNFKSFIYDRDLITFEIRLTSSGVTLS